MNTSQELILQFTKEYNEVFSEDGTVRACGRNKCKQLIKTSDIIDPSEDHGSLDTGNMKIDSIKNLKLKLDNMH